MTEPGPTWAHPGGGPGRRWRRPLAMALIVALAVAGLVLAYRSGDAPPPPTTSSSPPPVADRSYPSFAPDSAFSQDVRGRPVDPRSGAMMAALRHTIATRYGGVAAFNASAYAMSLAVATPQTPRRDIAFDDCQHKGAPSKGLYDGPAYFRDVPIPADAQASAGTDGELSVWSPDTDQLWEFWKAHRRSDGVWQACWGGRIDSVRSSRGQFTVPYGVSASGLSTTASAIRVVEGKSGRIEHAMGLAIPAPAHWRTVRRPATRSDGINTAADALPIGARLRLDPGLDVERLDIGPVAKAIARAAQRYGFIVVDTAGAVGVVAESGAAGTARTGTNPWPEILGGPSYQVLRGFPWDWVEVIVADAPSPVDRPAQVP